MLDVVSLRCPSCAGKLEVGKDLEQFACGYCGAEVVVRRSGGTVSLSPLVEGLKRVELGVDRTASELAIKRLEGEIASYRKYLESKWNAKSNNESMIIFGCIGVAAGIGACFVSVTLGVSVAVISIALAGTGVFNRLAVVKEIEEYQPEMDRRTRELAEHREIVRR